MKKYKTYILIALVFVSVYFLVQHYAPRQLNWSNTYENKDKIPMGTSALYEIMQKMSAYSPVKEVRLPIYNQLLKQGVVNDYYRNEGDSIPADLPDSLRHNYLFINDRFDIKNLDKNWLLSDVARGNDVFICAKDLSQNLCDTLNVTLGSFWTAGSVFTTKLPQGDYHYKPIDYIGWQSYFRDFDSTRTRVIGYCVRDSAIQVPNFICVNFGKGHFYINTMPELFTNYYIVNDTTYTYAFNSLSVLNNGKPMWWDEYYKVYRMESDNMLRYIFSEPALKLGWYIFLITVLMYALFESKRRQKAIAIIPPVRNDSLEFVRILGSFYFRNSQHITMAEKKWRFLIEQVRLRYNIIYESHDKSFAEKLSRKTGYPLSDVNELLAQASLTLNTNGLSEQQLMQFNHTINKFYSFTKII